MIKVIDVFAGPGGLGEGFSSYRGGGPDRRFELALSIEKDPVAHRTLRLRAFTRQFAGRHRPAAYFAHIRGELSWQQLAGLFPVESAIADREALNLTLGPGAVEDVRARVAKALGRTDRWVLVGGPPCQAYSLVGRARRRGSKGYDPKTDERQTLYVEYLQILADHAPPAFVMENVKGLLSAQLDSRGLFDRIRIDLHDPAAALLREGRKASTRRPRYELRALVADDSLATDDPRRYVVRAERFGIPQRRHRVILVGVRSDACGRVPSLRVSSEQQSVQSALEGLPRIRSGLSRTEDSSEAWLKAVSGSLRRGWLSQLDPDVRDRVRQVVQSISAPRAGRGGEVLGAPDDDLVLNHSARGHIVEDLDRYLFASCFASVRRASPVLAEFPRALLPAHANVRGDVSGTVFSDRFRTQLAGEPSTTVTSHISKDGHYYIHHDPSQCRSLTVREAARLQTFPDDYFFCGPRTAQYQQVGNAVPPKLAKQIAASIAALF
ncbi:MAG: DNA cytosine methyltransferase [Gemmatimonadota bacterium]|jgi:DNA (cytosine-5)-methyltransferase 1